MSNIIYGQNKIILFVTLQDSQYKNKDPYLKVNQLVISAFHFHYPCVYYEKVFKHFQQHLPPNTAYMQIRFIHNNVELPSDLPIGLYLDFEAELLVRISPYQLMRPQKLIKYQWKQAFTGINPIQGNNYMFKRLGQSGLKKKLQLYFQGENHGFAKEQFEGYEGTNILTRFLIQGEIIERKSEVGESRTIADLIKEELPALNQTCYQVISHGVVFDQGMTLKQFLDEWSYNDGYCYLKIDIRE